MSFLSHAAHSVSNIGKKVLRGAAEGAVGGSLFGGIGNIVGLAHGTGLIKNLNLKNPFDIGKKPGVPNPFQKPNLNSLNSPVVSDPSGNNALFNDLLTNIGGQNQNDSEALDQLLSQLGVDENQAIGSTKMDFADRGLGGPGQISDIEANALAQVHDDANNTRATARTATIGKGLDRLSSAYSDRYKGGLDTGKLDTTLSNDNKQLAAKLMADLYTNGAKNEIDTAQPGYLDSFLRNIKLGFNVGK